MVRIGIDIGGTFTDFVIYDQEKGALSSFKLPSTPDNPADAVIQGLQTLTDLSQLHVIHGSTVATNALLERKGARTALITTEGFKDVIQIGRQNRPSLYDWNANPLPPLVTSDMRFEVNERVEHTGDVSKPIDHNDINNLVEAIKAKNPESIAICLLFSFLHPQHEELIAERLEKIGHFVSRSSEVLPEFREYERTSTTVVNAYVSPKLAYYLTNLQSAFPGAEFQVMQSNGGMISIDKAKQFGVRCILSGPAGGIIGASHIIDAINQLGRSSISKVKMITFDMGGTSTDVSLINEKPSITKDVVIGDVPIALPMLDIHTIGAGGGSLASIDAGGALRVGPNSAGAQPGPACYGIGHQPTVTDANLVLGRILYNNFLGGKIRLHIDRARKSLQHLGEILGLDAYQTALGVIEVVNTHMEHALRLCSVEKGYDPKEFSMLTFGGAGGLHATDLARRLDIPLVIVPPLASTLSAFGMLAANFIKDYSQTIMIESEVAPQILNQSIGFLVEQSVHDLKEAGYCEHQILIELSVDMRYVGQSFELNIPFSQTLEEDFSATHEKVYGYRHINAKIEIVNVRVRAVGLVDKPQIPKHALTRTDPSSAHLATLPVLLANTKKSIPFYKGELLTAGNIIKGPSIIVRSDTTILLNANDIAEVDPFLNLQIRLE